ncbi:lipoate--protein ligase family protein [Fusibacter ferrireducens]|uniref:Lipoate--protein ligase family protein n=1 Tax=Fusibacter ferrireducens TaxID=2785058 RepID=A0ABR9ZQH0_9FIRM|nr:biotin/lipoate A/B protein ligase family protein [Fusibacter ferrireducens]MBF4692696.1 lipoate--protein ligase family protein [Fusibacter ferrireducens]
MEKILVVLSRVHDPYVNHAIEELLLTEYGAYARILFLWINSPAVVFGRNQNPWKEIHVQRAQTEGVPLVRRLSGGGAVFHDLGNLNYSFLESQSHYNEALHYDIICNSVLEFGIELTKNNRKDLLLEGLKVSGNAFYLKGNRRLHHGTLLVNTDKATLWQLLKKSDEKIESKGIRSVTSEVTTLKASNALIRIDHVLNAIVSTFYQVHHYNVETLTIDAIQDEFQFQYETIVKRLKSWEWTFGETPSFIYHYDEINYLKVRNGIIEAVTGDKLERLIQLEKTIKFNDQFKEV